MMAGNRDRAVHVRSVTTRHWPGADPFWYTTIAYLTGDGEERCVMGGGLSGEESERDAREVIAAWEDSSRPEGAADGNCRIL